MGNIDLSIIIVNYNTKKVTQDCIYSIIKSLKDSKIIYEIVVVDNASTDGSIKMLKKFKSQNPKIKIIESKKNLGFGKGNNLGARYTKGETLFFLNSDTLILESAIEKLYNFFVQQDSFKFLGGKLLNKDMTPQPSCGPFYSLPIIFAALFLKGDYWGLTRYSPNKLQQVDWVSGACIMTKKRDFEKLGGFDKKIFMYMEEVDLLYRAQKLKFETGFYPDARFIHFGSVSSGGRTFPILQVYNGFLYFYKKHHGRLQLALLRIMLKLKALIAWITGILTDNEYLKSTYEKAYKMV